MSKHCTHKTKLAAKMVRRSNADARSIITRSFSLRPLMEILRSFSLLPLREILSFLCSHGGCEFGLPLARHGTVHFRQPVGNGIDCKLLEGQQALGGLPAFTVFPPTLDHSPNNPVVQGMEEGCYLGTVLDGIFPCKKEFLFWASNSPEAVEC
mmetsp:Transcript_24814/g.50369  ORF Transcript_24814/g.50369 Transcript_24814/m.50369 type:complete len:153 (+) Transcript_24814:9-467(+)